MLVRSRLKPSESAILRIPHSNRRLSYSTVLKMPSSKGEPTDPKLREKVKEEVKNEEKGESGERPPCLHA